MNKLKTIFYDNQEPIVDDFNYIEDSKLEQLYNRYSDIMSNGVIPDVMNELDVEAVYMLDNNAIINVTDGVGYVAGKRVIINNNTTTWDPLLPDSVDEDGVATPLSTGSKNIIIPFTINQNGNSVEKARIFITHIQEVDKDNPAGIEIEKDTHKRQYKYYKDGFVISYALYTDTIPEKPTLYYENNPFVETEWVPLADVFIETNNIVVNNLIKPYCTLKVNITGQEEYVNHQKLIHGFGISNLVPNTSSVLQYVNFNMLITATSIEIPVPSYQLARNITLNGQLKYVKCVVSGSGNANQISVRIDYGTSFIEKAAESLNLNGQIKQIIFDLSSTTITGQCTISIKASVPNILIYLYNDGTNDGTYYDIIESVSVTKYNEYGLTFTPTVETVINDRIIINLPDALNTDLNTFLYIDGYRITKFFYKGDLIWDYLKNNINTELELSYTTLKQINNNNDIINPIYIYLICNESGELKFVKTLSESDIPLTRLHIRTLGTIITARNYDVHGGLKITIDKDFRLPINSLAINRLSSDTNIHICPQSKSTNTEVDRVGLVLSPYLTDNNIPTKEFKIQVQKINNNNTRVNLSLNNESVCKISNETGTVITTIDNPLEITSSLTCSNINTNNTLFQVIYSNIVTSAVSEVLIDLSLFNGNKKLFKLLFMPVNTVGNGRYFLQVSDLFLSGAYSRQSLLINGTSITANRESTSEFLYSNQNSFSLAEVILTTNNDKVLCLSKTVRNTESLQFFSITANVAISTISNIRIASENSGGIGVGSYIILEGLK